jgi:seryl-tRNA synthetase
MCGEVAIMAEDRKKTAVLVAGIVIPFLVGVVLGWYIWGHGRNKPVDYKQLLLETVTYISTIEEKNKALTTKVDSLDAEVNVLRQKGQATGAQSQNIITTLNQRVSSLEAENQKLKGQLQGLTSQANTSGLNPGAAPGGGVPK